MATSTMAVPNMAFLCCLASKHHFVPVVTDIMVFEKTDDIPELDVRNGCILC